MANEDELLESVARDGSLEDSKWPALLEHILPRLDHIIHNQFPVPIVPPPSPRQASGAPARINDNPLSPPVDSSPRPPDRDGGTHIRSSPIPPSASSPLSQRVIPDSQPSVSEADGTLPPQLLSLYSSVQTALQTSFVHSPPYTVQRLAELIISPTNHYKTLPSYLRALDRVISVSSTANNFPLPSLASNGEGDNYSFLGSVDSSEVDDFNGAALTRIPWLRDTASLLSSGERPLTTDLRTESTSLIDGPNGAGSIETVTVSVNGLSNTTRNPMQQRLNVSGRTESEVDARMEHGLASADDLQASNVLVEAEEEEVHARGPEEIGVEDLGPQDAARSPGSNHHLLHSAIFDAEAALGRPGEAEPGPISEVGNK